MNHTSVLLLLVCRLRVQGVITLDMADDFAERQRLGDDAEALCDELRRIEAMSSTWSSATVGSA